MWYCTHVAKQSLLGSLFAIMLCSLGLFLESYTTLNEILKIMHEDCPNGMFCIASKETFTHSSIKDACWKCEQDVMGIDKLLTYQFTMTFSLPKLYPINGVSNTLWSKKVGFTWVGECGCPGIQHMWWDQLCGRLPFVKHSPWSIALLS